MLVGQSKLAQGDVRRITVDYSDWLQYRGSHIQNVNATVITAGVVSTVSSPQTDSKSKSAIFFVHASSVLNEAFTVQVQVTDTLGQVVNDTVTFTVIAP